MAAAIGVADRVLAGEKRGAGALQARVRQGRVRAGGDRPRYQGPVEAVEGEDRSRSSTGAELGDVGQPEPVRGVGMEAALDQVVRRIGDLACVRAVPLGPLQVDDAAALLAHEAPYDLLGHDDGILPVAEPAGDVAVAPVRLAASNISTILLLARAYLSRAQSRRAGTGGLLDILKESVSSSSCGRWFASGARSASSPRWSEPWGARLLKPPPRPSRCRSPAPVA